MREDRGGRGQGQGCGITVTAGVGTRGMLKMDILLYFTTLD